LDSPAGFEERLVHALQPARFFVLAHALHAFMQLGLLSDIAERPATIDELAARFGLDRERLAGLLQYLANEGIVDLLDSGRVGLTDEGAGFAEFWPWYSLLVGGYSRTFGSLAITLRSGAPYAERDGLQVGIGSGGISQYDALPMTRNLLAQVGDWQTIVDIGCGDGSYLIDLCALLPNARGVGVEPNPDSRATAEALARERQLEGRVSFLDGDAMAMPDLTHLDGPLCFLTAFVLQEVLEQEGREAVINLLRSNFTAHPDAHWIVIEVDECADDTEVMAHPLALAYYNPYYLIHKVTEQRLEKVAFWEALFDEAGVRVCAMDRPDPRIDSLGLKVGFLLRRVPNP